MEELRPEPDPQKTLFKLIFVVLLLIVAAVGMVYSGHLLLTLPAAPTAPVAPPKP